MIKLATATLVLLNALALIFLLLIVSSCSWLKSESKATASDVVDCTSANVRSLNKQFGPVLDELLVQATGNDGEVDWTRIKHATRAFAVSTGLCVLAHSVQRALVPIQHALDVPKASPLELDAESLRAGFRELAAGRTYRTELGTL